MNEELEWAEGAYLAVYEAKCISDREIDRLEKLVNLLEDEIDRCHATIDLLRARLSDDGEGEVEAERSPTSAT